MEGNGMWSGRERPCDLKMRQRAKARCLATSMMLAIQAHVEAVQAVQAVLTETVTDGSN